MTYVVLDRIEDVAEPPYCIHGRATCLGCGKWCWTGSETHARVLSGAMKPVCMPCAKAAMGEVPADTINLRDHRRVDGPHP